MVFPVHPDAAADGRDRDPRRAFRRAGDAAGWGHPFLIIDVPNVY